MRSITLHLLAAAALAIPSISRAQSAPEDVNHNDPFQAVPAPQPLDDAPSYELYAPRPIPKAEALANIQEDDDAQAQINQNRGYRVEKRSEMRPKGGRRAAVYSADGGSGNPVGIVISTVPPAMAVQLRLEPGVGVVVEQVAPGSPAEAAGIEQYDVIEKVNHEPVHRPQDLAAAIRRRQGSVSLDIVRQAHRVTLNVDSAALARPNEFSMRIAPKPRVRIDGKDFQFRQARDAVARADGFAWTTNDKDREQADRDREQAERDRQQADRDRQQAEREQAQQERDRQREQAQQQRERAREQVRAEREKALQNLKNVERDQLNALRSQLQSQLDQERKELDRAREQLNRASEQINRQLSELRSKLEPELRSRIEEQLRKGEDQIREKMKFLEDQTQKMEPNESPEKP